MKIINSSIEKDIKANRTININLGSGMTPIEGFYSLDQFNIGSVDILADLNKPLTLLPDNCVHKVFSYHVLEHVENFIPLMSELHRLVKSDGVIEVVVPHFSNVYSFSDPTHVRFFGLYTMYYFSLDEDQPARKVPSFYTDFKFKVESVKIEFYKDTVFDHLFGPLFYRFVNFNHAFQNFYERRLSSFFHASQIRYTMSPIK
jgi:ubiquinone/menaquinone biosynthesis C-methylase UbiE